MGENSGSAPVFLLHYTNGTNLCGKGCSFFPEKLLTERKKYDTIRVWSDKVGYAPTAPSHFGAPRAALRKFFVTDGSQSTAWEQRIINADRLGTVRFIYGPTAPFLFFERSLS